MNNVHDMGGMQGFGPVRMEVNEPVFHADWERRAFALTVAMNTARQWNIDTSRSMRESIAPLRYLSNTYYQTWLDGLERLLVHTNMVSPQELKSGKPEGPGLPGVHTLSGKELPGALLRGWPSEREAAAPARFAVGDRVRTVQFSPKTHTRLPRYCRDKVGVVTRILGFHVFPDKNAIGPDEPQWMYMVEFDARSLWGPDTTADSVSVNCWEPYLLPEQAK